MIFCIPLKTVKILNDTGVRDLPRSNAIVATHVNKFTVILPAPEKYFGVDSTEFQWV
jgi:hypothetical protein